MDQVTEVRERTDLVAIMSEYLEVKRAGRNFKTNCPFHNEKTASLVISPERQIWRCFGCGKGGDVYTFLMDYERLEFGEALRMLAKRAGIELKQSVATANISSKKDKLYEINKAAAEYYHYLLTGHEVGKKAYEYLTVERKILPQTIKTFKLGYSLRNGTALLTYLMKRKKYSREELFDAGLITRRGDSVVDFFQHRIMFPLFDHRDNVTGFSGRVMDADSQQAKYINTRETLIYHKGRAFFGLNIAKDSIKKENQVILMEGEFDLISSFQAGITNVVAVKGTALTEDQVTLIARFAQKITLCFDMDNAGQEAVRRSLQVIEKKGLRTTVIVVPNGKDADEAIKESEWEFKKAAKNDIEVYDFLLEQSLKKYDKHSINGKKALTDLLLPIYGQIQNEIVKEHYLTKLSREIGTSIEALIKQIERLDKKKIVSTISADEPMLVKIQKPRDQVLEDYLIGLLIQDTQLRQYLTSIENVIGIYKFKQPACEYLLDYLMAYAEVHETFNPKSFVETLPAELIPTFDSCFLLPLPKFASIDDYISEIKTVAHEMYGLFVHEQIKIMGQLISEKEKVGDVAELEELQHRLTYLVSLLKKR